MFSVFQVKDPDMSTTEATVKKGRKRKLLTKMPMKKVNNKKATKPKKVISFYQKCHLNANIL